MWRVIPPTSRCSSHDFFYIVRMVRYSWTLHLQPSIGSSHTSRLRARVPFTVPELQQPLPIYQYPIFWFPLLQDSLSLHRFVQFILLTFQFLGLLMLSSRSLYASYWALYLRNLYWLSSCTTILNIRIHCTTGHPDLGYLLLGLSGREFRIQWV